MKKYLTISQRGKKELYEDFETAKKVAEKKSKTQKFKWSVYEMPEAEVKRYNESGKIYIDNCKEMYKSC